MSRSPTLKFEEIYLSPHSRYREVLYQVNGLSTFIIRVRCCVTYNLSSFLRLINSKDYPSVLQNGCHWHNGRIWRSKWVKNIPQLSFECRNYFLMSRNFFSSRRNFWQGPSVSAGSVKTGPSAPAARQCQLIDLCFPPPASAMQLASYMPSWI